MPHVEHKNPSGFTIVELLVVIVVIGILAAITVVSYSGISRRAILSTLQSDLANSSKQLKLSAVDSGIYPTSIDCSQIDSPYNKCLKSSPGNVFTYYGSDETAFTLVNYNNNNTCVITDSTVPECSNGKLALSESSSSGSSSFQCGVFSDGKSYCWGQNAFGQFGTGSTTANLTPVPANFAGVLSGKIIRSLVSGVGHTCAIASDSLAYCWGLNSSGQLGNNSTAINSLPVAVYTGGALSGKTVKSIASGDYHTCVIASDSLAYCWGRSAFGELGNNSMSNSLVPVAVSTSGLLNNKTIKSIAASYGHTCAIASDNLVYCWGQNDTGKLGNNSTTNSLVPVAVNTSGVLNGKTIKQISLGYGHTCAIASDNLVYCWGSNSAGQLGNNSMTSSFVPVAVNTSGVLNGKTIKYISAGGLHTCAIASDGKSYCWGLNSTGQLGNNSTTNSLVPVAVDTSGVLGGKTIRSLSLAYTYTCAIASDNKPYCWGRNDNGQLGNNSTTNSLVPVAVVMP